MPGTLIICGTPIGNLGDASARLAAALGECTVVYAEDTRRTRVLTSALGVEVRLQSYFAGNEVDRAREVAARLAAGETVGLVSDAGTPGIADPGYSAVRAALEVGAVVTVVPGPSAVTAALAVSGLPSDRFAFEGFLPRRGGARRRRLERIAHEDRTVVLFASPARVHEDLADLAATLGSDRAVAVVRELTKVHEEVWRGSLGDAAAAWAEQPRRGEHTLVVAGRPADEEADDLAEALGAVEALVAGGASLAAAVREVAAATGTRRRRLYEAALRSGD